MRPEPPSPFDEDALLAAVDLVGRSGARGFEFGYLHDDVPVEEAAWWAKAQYRGARIQVENHRGPVEAAEALAREILTGGKCAHCGGLVNLGGGAALYRGTDDRPAHMADGSVFTAEDARSRPLCRWTRQGARWVAGCSASAAAGRPSSVTLPGNRAERRAQARASRRPRR